MSAMKGYFGYQLTVVPRFEYLLFHNNQMMMQHVLLHIGFLGLHCPMDDMVCGLKIEGPSFSIRVQVGAVMIQCTSWVLIQYPKVHLLLNFQIVQHFVLHH